MANATGVEKARAAGWTSFLTRNDTKYDEIVSKYSASTPAGKAFYLSFHLMPGVLAYIALNVPSMHAALLNWTKMPDKMLQAWTVLFVLFGWHLVVPLLTLRFVDHLSFRQTVGFLSLDRFDVKGFFIVLPLVFIVFALLSLPYMRFIYPALSSWIAAIPGLNPPSYSIYRDPSAAYSFFSPLMIAIALVGNFFCEELYFRGYLLKKIGFLGEWAWVVNSSLFALYHLWQAPTTWALIGPAFVFGALMRWRKNLYPLIGFHFLVNIVWGAFIGAVLGR